LWELEGITQQLFLGPISVRIAIGPSGAR